MHLPPRDSRDEDFFIQMGSTSPAPAHAGDPFDDVFGSDSDSPAFLLPSAPLNSRESHPSDITRLEQEHATAGYREGITEAKAISIQAGFDEGFSLGATIGQKAGQLLGYLEGIAGALKVEGGDDCLRASRLLNDARKEMSTDKIFDEQYWAPDGTWKYEIDGVREDGDIIFEDVANAHPMISKWTRTLNQEVERWNIDRDILDVTSHAGETAHEVVLEKKEVKAEHQSREMLDW